MKKIVMIAAIALPSVAILSCNSIARESAPVELLVSASQNLNQIDLQAGAGGCATTLGTVLMSVRLLQNQNDPTHPTNNNFNDVKLDRYQVTYQRTDGGKLIPPTFVRSTAQVIAAGASPQGLSDFIVFETNAFNLAPFASLLPQNGGRDPETGLNFVKMDIILTIYGQTLAGERVQGSARFPVNFCYNCGGCF
ncbi:MAG TPA: hypothetical protein VGQ46_03730 [Thermoanaerobaculia bacterium]|jgi:hypothetical protein|nr:hypothetical protein [Thermoanaerobaculia bacterium]